MTRRLRGPALALVVALGAGSARAKQCLAVDFPEQIQSGGATLVLNGLGLRQATWLKVNVYVAALYVTQASRDANAILDARSPMQLTLHFVRDVGGADLSQAWDEGFKSNAGSALPALQNRIESFKGMMSDVKTGERLRFSYDPGTGIQVDVDGRVAGSIAGDDFARALFSIWLGSHPPNPGIREGLLGGACG